MKKYILWDLDGTLINTNEIIIESWKATANWLGGPVPSDREIMATFGETIRDTVKRFWPEADIEETIDYYRGYQEEHLVRMVKLFPGVYEALEELKKKEVSLSVVTSRVGFSADEYLRKFDLYKFLDVVITCDDVSAHKPDPAPINLCISRLEEMHGRAIDRSECIMIGDTLYDIGCANNAGIDSALVEWSHPVDKEKMAELKLEPTMWFKSPFDVRKVALG